MRGKSPPRIARGGAPLTITDPAFTVRQVDRGSAQLLTRRGPSRRRAPAGSAVLDNGLRDNILRAEAGVCGAAGLRLRAGYVRVPQRDQSASSRRRRRSLRALLLRPRPGRASVLSVRALR